MTTGATLTVGKGGLSLKAGSTDLAFPKGTTKAQVMNLLMQCGYVCIGSKFLKGPETYALCYVKQALPVGNGHQYGA